MRFGLRKLGAVLLAGTLVLAACGSDDDDEEATDTTEAEDSEDEGSESEIDHSNPEIDRTNRFASLDTYCTPAEEEPEEAPEATDDGITETEINITHIRTKLEDLAKLGFAVEVGETKDIAETFVNEINEECGGIHGRKIKLDLIENPALAGEGQTTSSLAQAACIKAAEDYKAVFAFSSTGFGDVGVPCLTVDHEVIYITSYTLSLESIEAAGNRLYGTGLAGEQSLTYMARDVASRGDFEGKKVGIVRSDATPDADIVERGLVKVLEDELGVEVTRVDTIGCGGTNSCGEGVIDSVRGMIADDVDVIIPVLNVISLPGYIAEMVTQGVKPGDFQFYQTGFAAQSGDLVAGKVVEFGGDAAGKLYNGTVITSSADTGRFRLPGYTPGKFGELCADLYAEKGKASDREFSPTDEATSSKYGGVVGVCSMVRMMARAIDAAGPNPTREDLAEAMENLGGFDQATDRLGSFGPGKYTGPNSIFTSIFHYPCPHPTTYKSKACIVVDGEGRPRPSEPAGD